LKIVKKLERNSKNLIRRNPNERNWKKEKIIGSYKKLLETVMKVKKIA
jgi:hypothetical protein